MVVGAGGMWGYGWLLMLLFWLVVVVGVVMLIVWLIRQMDRSRGTGRSDDGALRVLRDRYARGEISQEEYQRMRSDLSHDG